MPKLSVFIINYNHAQYLVQSIESVLNQTYKDIELIVVDDGSTDNSVDIMCHYRESDSRVKMEVFSENRGVFSGIKRAMELCTGEYIFARAADDYLTDTSFFEKAMKAFEKYPEAAGVFGASRIINEENGYVGEMGRMSGVFGGMKEFFFTPEFVRQAFLAHAFFVPGASSIWKRKLVNDMGGFDPDLGPQADYYLNHVLSMLCGLVGINETVAMVRHSDHAFSKQEGIAERHFKVADKIRGAIKELDDDLLWTSWMHYYRSFYMALPG